MIIKRRHTKSFVTLENALVRDRRLSLDEHGMLHYLLSLPDDWEVSRAHCAKFWNIGRDRAARIFRSLRKCGWAQIERMHGEDGTFLGVRWIITDEPGEEVTDAAIDQDADEADSDAESDAGEEASEDAAEPCADEPPANHDTENPEHGSTVVRVNHTPDKAYHGLYIDSKKTDSEENRLPQNGAGEKSIETAEPQTATFAGLLKIWPADHVLSRVAAEQAWQRLVRAARQHAFDAVPRYLDDCVRKSRKVCDVTTYLREARFDRFSGHGKPGVTSHAKAFSPQWHRWRDYFVATGKSVSFMEAQAAGGIGWTTPQEWPPALPPRSGADKPTTTGPPEPVLMDEAEAQEFR